MTTVLVTGANRGIGLALCRAFGARGDRVIAACRQPSAALERAGVRVESGVDVTDRASLDALAGRLAGITIDILVNNAGILAEERLGRIGAEEVETIERQFAVNALGPLLVTQALLPLLPQGGKVAIVTSRMGSLADNQSGGYYGYRMSKAAVNAAGVSLARDLAPRGIAVALLHPGYVRTGMTGGEGYVDPADAAAGLVARIDALGPETTGGFWHANGDRLPW